MEKSPRFSDEGSYHDSVQEECEDELAPLNGTQQQLPISHHSTGKRSRLSIGLRIVSAFILIIASLLILFKLLSNNSDSISTTSDSLSWFYAGSNKGASPSLQSERLDSSNIVFGLGIGDVTGPIVQTNQMGYASLPQTNTGLHIRQRSRAFIVGNSASGVQRKAKVKKLQKRIGKEGELEERLLFGGLSGGDDGEDPADGLSDRWVFINSDICMVSYSNRLLEKHRFRLRAGEREEKSGSLTRVHSKERAERTKKLILPLLQLPISSSQGDTAVRRAVIERLREMYPSTYGERNLAFVGTHSHSGVAGYLNALLPTLTSLGVVQETFDAIVDGTVVAIKKAHEDYEARRSKEGADETKNRIWFGNTTVKGAHINREYCM